MSTRRSHVPPTARRWTAALAGLALLPALGHNPSSAEPPVIERTTGTLSVTPSVVVGGQAVRMTGSIGAQGRRKVHVQWHMNRPGDVWVDVADTTHKTDRKGRFDFTFPAPSAVGIPIGLRVVAGALKTPDYQLKARQQELTVSLADAEPNRISYAVLPGLPFEVVVDTVPTVRAALGTPPVLPGRVVSLQQRVDGNRWQTIRTSSTDLAGQATFSVAAPLVGALVLRARQERWTQGRDEIGWFASFPTYFGIGLLPDRSQRRPLARTRTHASPVTERKDPLRPTASQTWGWGGSLWDYDWGFGEDFDSKPYRGTWLGGRWLDTSDGSGRAVPFNGGLVLQSKLTHTGDGDHGTSTATLQGSAQKRGRWEFRLQGHAWESGPRPYRFLLELVPEGAPVVTCSPASIVVADVVMGTPGLGLGVRSRAAGSVWTARDAQALLAEAPFNMAVEVGKKHITWFRDAKPLFTLKGRRAQPGVPLVPRLSLVGQQEEMNGAQVDSDWQRAFSIKRGKQKKSGRALDGVPYSDAC
ncbi:hypothetical protein [Nocardioides dilutus]